MRHQAYAEKTMQKRQPQGYRFVTNGYDQLQVISVTRGELWIRAQGEQTCLGPGGIALLRKGSVFELFCKEKGYRGVAFAATGALPEDFVGRSESLQADAQIRALIDLIERQLVDPIGEFAEIMVGLGRAMAWESIRLSRSRKSDRLSDRGAVYWVRAACDVLDATIYSGRSVRKVLAVIPLSYRQLSRHFRAVLDMSPKEYQVQARIGEAKRLLTETRLSITEIAMELGYSSSQHLATQFVETTGSTPGSFRRERKSLQEAKHS